jgi:hypothetical protein
VNEKSDAPVGKGMSRAEYRAQFGLRGEMPYPEKLKNALQTALDIRKFEIELYWKRATYFWTFIAASFLAYGALWSKGDGVALHYGLQEIFAGLGFIFTVAWWYVNKGSRFWQKNWEAHVDLLENLVQGPMYKTLHFDLEEEKLLLGAKPYSVSKVNQLVVLFVGCVWVALLLDSAAHLSPSVHNFFHQHVGNRGFYTTASVLGVCAPIGFAFCIRCLGKSGCQSENADPESGLLLRPPAGM